MSAGMSLLILLLVGIFIIIYKRKMLIKMFSINISTLADEFRIEMETTADRAVKRLEQQMAQLEYLLDEADTKISALEECLRRAENINIMPAESNRSIASVNPELHSAADAFQSRQLHEQPTDLPSSYPNQPPSQFNSRLLDVSQDKREQVIAMHRQGYNVLQIAKATSMGKGEVMLLLELHKN
jgi:acetolactate synthase regulatory subunit